jgi:hypothetical protein
MTITLTQNPHRNAMQPRCSNTFIPASEAVTQGTHEDWTLVHGEGLVPLLFRAAL